MLKASEALEEHIKQYYAAGWKPQGGVSTIIEPYLYNAAQAMIKEK